MVNALRIIVLLSFIAVASSVYGAEFTAVPSVAVSEEYTDNVFDSSTNRMSDFITHALPGLVMSYKAPAFNGDISYLFDYRNYARKSRGDEIAHALSAKGQLIAVKDLLFLDVTDDFHRVSLDITRDVTRESLFFSQSDRNVVSAAPYLMLRPTDRMQVKVGYRFIDTRYFDSPAIDKTDHIGSLDASYELMKHFSLTASYSYTRELSAIDNFNQHYALGGFRYEYTDTSFVFAQAGNSWTTYESGSSVNSMLWNVGVTHVFDTVTASLTTGVKFNEDPLRNILQETFVTALLEKRLKYGSLSLMPSYSEYVLTKTDILQTKRYGATTRGQYEFNSDLNATLAFTAEKFEQPLLGSYTRRFVLDSGLSYLLAKQLTLTFSYIYADYSSPEIAADNRHVNRVVVEIKKTF